MPSIRFFLALIIFVAGGTTSLRTDAVTVTDEYRYDNLIHMDGALLSMGGVARPTDLLESGSSRVLASTLKNKRILETTGSQKTLAKDYDPNVAEVENFKAKRSFYDLMFVASENQNAEGKRELEDVPKKRASIMAVVTNSAPIKPFAPQKPIAPIKPFAPKKPYAPQNPMAPMRLRKPTAPLMPAAPKKPAKPIGCPSGFNYNTCCQGCGAVFTTQFGLLQGVSVYNPSDTSPNGKMNCWDVSQVTDINSIFVYRGDFNEQIECWNTSKVTSMYGTFYGASSFNQPLNKWDTSSVTNMGAMFSDAYNFNQPLNQWNTSRVESMWSMFYNANSFNQPLSQWNTSRVMYMSDMFHSATKFNQPLNQWNISKVETMWSMFQGASSFNQNLCSWYNNISTTYTDMFAGTNCANKTDPVLSTKKNFCANCYR